MERLIVDLKEEVEAGVLTELELNDYINLFEMASRHIFRKYPEYHEEVLKLTEPMIKLPSVQIRELQQTIAQAEATIAQKDAYIAELEQKLAAAIPDRNQVMG